MQYTPINSVEHHQIDEGKQRDAENEQDGKMRCTSRDSAVIKLRTRQADRKTVFGRALGCQVFVPAVRYLSRSGPGDAGLYGKIIRGPNNQLTVD